MAGSVKLQERDDARRQGLHAGSQSRRGQQAGLYRSAHSAIVLICIGGLLDGDMVVRAQMWLGGKTPYTGAGRIPKSPPEHRLSVRNPTYRWQL